MKEIELLGVTVTPATGEEISETILKNITEKQKCIMGTHNLHSIYLYHRLKSIRKFYALADYIYIDGMPIVWMAKCLGYFVNRSHKSNFKDLFRTLSFAEKRAWKIFYLGAKPGVVEEGIQNLKKDYPNLQMGGTHGYFDATPGSLENEEVLNIINSYQPDILAVGMGTPRQEYWIAENYDQVHAYVIMTMGGTIDYVAGNKPLPPHWMGMLGLHWLYRLFSEPRRLWHRYLIEPWFILYLFLKDLYRYKLKQK